MVEFSRKVKGPGILGSWNPTLEEAHMGMPGRPPVQPPSVPRNAPPTQLSLVLSLKNSNGLSAVTPARHPGDSSTGHQAKPPARDAQAFLLQELRATAFAIGSAC